MLEGYVYMYEYMILVISWVITFCIVCAVITIISVKIFEWTEYRNEENYSIIWGRGGKKPEPSNEDIVNLRKDFEFLNEVTKNLSQRTELMKQISINLQAQIDELTSKVISEPSSEFNLLRTEINKLISDDNEQDNGANSPTN